jgi:hypothetical protein
MTWRHVFLATRLIFLCGCADAMSQEDEGASAGAEAVSETRPLVIGIRSANTHVKQAFDDMMIVKVPGKPDVTFAASTHPWFQNNAAATDADHDGVPDVGMLRPGRYRAHKVGTHFGAPKYAVSQTNGKAAVPGWRNTNHDDVYSEEEIAASEARGDLLTDILVHAAGNGSLPPIGCQVLAPADMNALAKLVGNDFDYELRDADADAGRE